jgi:hypothetical protein
MSWMRFLALSGVTATISWSQQTTFSLATCDHSDDGTADLFSRYRPGRLTVCRGEGSIIVDIAGR